ncbi:MAG: hypothetical protein IAE82_19240 [Opitutaceae bacterium]|nr:hypothetical protein [Opitutaceae bacterium]
MKNTRIAFGVLTLLAVAASATAVHYYLENDELRRQLLTASSEAASPASQAADIQAANPTVAAAAPGREEAPPAPPEEQAGPPPGAGARRDERRARMAEMAGRLANDPEARAAMLGRMKSEVDRVYGDLFVKLGLNEDQADMLRSLLAERQMARLEGEMAARVAGDDAARAAARTTADTRMQSIESGINALLGPDGVGVIDDYQRSQPMRQAVSDVARRASYAGVPLSTEAGDRLVAAMQSAAQEHPVSTSAGWRRETLTQQAVDTQLATLRAQNEAVLTQAREFLSQAQLEALVARQIEQYEQTQAQLNVRLRNPDVPFIGGGPGGPSPGEFGGRRGGP